MAVARVGEKALAAVETDCTFKRPAIPKKKVKVLDEETYTEGLEKIIVRDFYPDLPKLKAQSEYLEALAKNDTTKLREIHIKYGPKRPASNTPNIYDTPETFETPTPNEGGQSNTPRSTPAPSHGSSSTGGLGSHTDTHNPEPQKKKEATELPLDKYLSKVTSEDNASFDEILKETQKKHAAKHAWLYDQEIIAAQERKDYLALPSIEVQAIQEGPRTQELQTWEYKNRNALMYVPDGVELSTKERIETKTKPREIHHNNTRFVEQPFNTSKSKESIAQAASAQMQIHHGKIGVDGKELLPDQSPAVGGFNFVATPSPAPGLNESPLMTWGEIEGTPFRLDGGDTPITKTTGPIFRIPQMPRKDELLMELTEKNSRQHRAKKQEALKCVTALASPSPKFGAASKSARLSGMSPAAQRLASSKLGIRINTDKALRASYTPSPRLSAAGTPTPRSTPNRTPKSLTKTQKATPKTSSTPKQDHPEPASLTDNLLNLPTDNLLGLGLPKKRPNATDFF